MELLIPAKGIALYMYFLLIIRDIGEDISSDRAGGGTWGNCRSLLQLVFMMFAKSPGRWRCEMKPN